VAVATGALWVDLEVATTGRVLLVLGEEEEEEAKRRLHYAGAMMGLTAEQKDRAAKNLVVLPMAGRDVALTRSLEDVEPGHLPETPLLHELRRRLEADGPWALVVLDPLARFAGADVETDNAAATRFVQVLEQLVKAPGSPTVLLTHHTTKTARREGAGSSDAAAATAQRGASALTDGVRWQANLAGGERFPGAPRIIEFRVVKTNYGPPVDVMTLCAPDDAHGALRKATSEEVRKWTDAREEAAVEEAKEKKRIQAKAQGRESGKFAGGANHHATPGEDDGIPEGLDPYA
jgi:RecA-family ATPase